MKRAQAGDDGGPPAPGAAKVEIDVSQDSEDEAPKTAMRFTVGFDITSWPRDGDHFVGPAVLRRLGIHHRHHDAEHPRVDRVELVHRRLGWGRALVTAYTGWPRRLLRVPCSSRSSTST